MVCILSYTTVIYFTSCILMGRAVTILVLSQCQNLQTICVSMYIGKSQFTR